MCRIVFLIAIAIFAIVGQNGAILVDDQDHVQAQLHQMALDIQNLKTALAEKDVHFVQMQNVVHGLGDRLNQKDAQVTNLQNAMTEKTNDIKNLTQQIVALKGQVRVLEASETPIAFYAYHRGNLLLNTMHQHQTIVYNQVDLNIGSGYNPANGKFTTPKNGTYVFFVATGAIDKSHAVVELTVNGIIKDIGWADSMDHPDRSFATTATPLSLKEGDVVLARIGPTFGGNLLESDTLIRCSFSGFRLY